MKRLCLLLLSAVLCFALVACGKENKYADLNQMLEEGRYSEAIDYIQALQGSSNPGSSSPETSNTETSESTPNSEPTVDAEVQALIDELMGEWVITKADDDLPQKIVFQPDGICIVDGKEMTWKREATSLQESDSAFIALSTFLSIWDGETKCYNVQQPSKSDAGELSFTFYEEGGYIVTPRRYICLDNYEVVELTMDNWQALFEWTEEPYHNTNAFGDVTTMGTHYRFTLKEEYYDRLSLWAKSAGAVEISYSTVNYSVTVNPDGKTYTKGSFADVGGTGGTHTWTTEFENYNYQGLENIYFGAWYNSEGTWERTLDESKVLYCEYVESKNVLRIQGTLYLLKEQ